MNKQTARLLEQHFDTAFAAPDGIAKLRELILTLAMQGRLVEQDPSDPQVSELLKEIQAEKQRLVKAGKIKKHKPLPPIKPEEVPYELPKGWEWVRFGKITINRDAERIPVSKDDRKKMKGKYDYYGASGVIDKVNDYIFDKSLLLIGEDGANLINRSSPIAFMAHGKYWVNNHAHVIDAHDYFILLWLEKYINAIDLKPYVTGTAQPKMNQTKMNLIMVALPPLSEQHRIVARIDQLMARCDELETLRKEREEKRLAIHAAAINQLIDTPNGSAWNFIQQHFGELYTVKENVAELRKAILQLAVMGRLVPQNPDDPPASELLKEIKAEKQRLVKAGKIKKSKPLPPINLEELPFELPQDWECVRFEDVVEIGSGITKGRKLNGRKVISIPYLRVANVQRGFLDLDEIKEIEIPIEETNKYHLISGDLLITEGGDWDKVGRTCIWKEEIPLCGHQNHIFRARKLLDYQNEIWLEKYLNSPLARSYFASASKQTTNLASINKTQLRSCLVPIPPLPEQHRIVARIDQLMALCDTLEHQIDAATNKQTEILNAVMARMGG